jgi:ammonia channel protein AmtB
MAPSSGFHSVIERPESVSRVAPPTATMAITSAATLQSQAATQPVVLSSILSGLAAATPGAIVVDPWICD